MCSWATVLTANRHRLREIARAEGVPESLYALEGDEGNWAGGFDSYARHKAVSDAILVLRIVPGGWAICTYERGDAFGEMRFDTEDEACDELLRQLLLIAQRRDGGR
jgi:hypothetical protein